MLLIRLSLLDGTYTSNIRVKKKHLTGLFKILSLFYDFITLNNLCTNELSLFFAIKYE